MGMTIDTAILRVKHSSMSVDDKETADCIINTMRKYQKIEEILKDDTYYEEYGNNAERFIVSAISEVLEDAKN